MQENWSVMLNVILLIGVVITIGFLVKLRLQRGRELPLSTPSLGNMGLEPCDGVIAMRKISMDDFYKEKEVPAPVAAKPLPKEPEMSRAPQQKSIVLLLQAKENRQLAGYELLQTVLAAGLRFGEGQLFHRHQHPNGQGPVLCSLAAATATGVFDLQNIGAFSVKGLCLFMSVSQSPDIDKERFTLMLDTAKQLAEGLDTRILDQQQRALTEERIQQYYQELSVNA
jgi:cell division protein ZipA